MPQNALLRLNTLLTTVPSRLLVIDDNIFSYKPQSTIWSKKEILGHLIDSAANNHQRFIRVQCETNPTIFYDQDKWVTYNVYQNSEKELLIDLWSNYNKHLLYILKQIPNDNLTKTCIMKDGTTWTLSMLITDYVAHMEHHLKQILDYI